MAEQTAARDLRLGRDEVYVPLQAQRQDSLAAQLDDLIRYGDRLGLYDATDFVRAARSGNRPVGGDSDE